MVEEETMIPGTISKTTESTVASATSIRVATDVVVVTGAVQIDTIQPAFGGYHGQFVILVPKDGSIILGATGNIAVGITAVINRAVWLIYVKSLQKWIINSGV